MLLGKKIVDLRKSKGISQELLAESAQVSLRTIQRIEKGDTVPRLFTIKTIATTLGVTVEELSFAEERRLETDSATFAKLRIINLSALLVLIFPLGNIILPLAIWYQNKHTPLIREVGGKVISFQIMWTMAAAVMLPLVYLVNYLITGSFISGRIPSFFLAYLFLLLVHAILTIRVHVQLTARRTDIFDFLPLLL